MSWEFKPVFDAGHVAALSGGKNLVYLSPPAWWATMPLFDHWAPHGDPGLHTLILASPAAGITEAARAIRSAAGMGSIHPATGLSRTTRLLENDSVGTLVSSPADVMSLLQRSAIDFERVDRLVIAWPEMMIEQGSARELDSVLAEAGKTQRIVVTSDESQIADFLERHARRSPRVVAGWVPEEPTRSVRYAVAESTSLDAAVRAALDIANPGSAFIWDPRTGAERRWAGFTLDPSVGVGQDPGTGTVDLALAVQLPSADALEALGRVAGEILVLIGAAQVHYLRRITDKARVMQLPDEVDRAKDRAARLRDDVRDLIEHSRGSAELLALAPLFESYDPAIVAAALASRGQPLPPEHSTQQEMPAWVRLHASIGKRDGVGPGDIVGAILNSVGVQKRQVGKIELRDRFSLIEVRAEIAQQVLRGLDGIILKGKKVAARIDRR